MSSKKHHGGPAPVPPGNQTNHGPQEANKQVPPPEEEIAGFSEHDPKRRLGNYETGGGHAIEQPSGKQGPNK